MGEEVCVGQIETDPTRTRGQGGHTLPTLLSFLHHLALSIGICWCLTLWQAVKYRARGLARFGLRNPRGRFPPCPEQQHCLGALGGLGLQGVSSRGTNYFCQLSSVFLPASLAAPSHSVPVSVWQEHLRSSESLVALPPSLSRALSWVGRPF